MTAAHYDLQALTLALALMAIAVLAISSVVRDARIRELKRRIEHLESMLTRSHKESNVP